jgi:hypothetical protein
LVIDQAAKQTRPGGGSKRCILVDPPQDRNLCTLCICGQAARMRTGDAGEPPERAGTCDGDKREALGCCTWYGHRFPPSHRQIRNVTLSEENVFEIASDAQAEIACKALRLMFI